MSGLPGREILRARSGPDDLEHTPDKVAGSGCAVEAIWVRSASSATERDTLMLPIRELGRSRPDVNQACDPSSVRQARHSIPTIEKETSSTQSIEKHRCPQLEVSNR